MRKVNLILGLFLLIFMLNNAADGTKLNYPRVLLPIFDKISVNFTLEVIEKGCFKWISSRQDLILITPLYEDVESECSHSAAVTVLSRERHRNTAIVLAEDLATGESLRCDVILDVIDTLGVHTTTRQLYLEEAPETFELRAEDSQGNAFTTLEGIEFDWTISSPHGGSANYAPALRFLTFTESAYHEVPASLAAFEAQKVKGYMVLLEGINTGTAKVTVSLPYAEYAQVRPIEVHINVLANIILEPSEVHILAGDTIQFRVLQLKMGKLQEISLNEQYFLEVADVGIAKIQGDSATGLRLGRTAVVLRDRNVPSVGGFGDTEDSAVSSSIPSARITVAVPAKLGVDLLPHHNWLTVAGESHVVAFDLYTSDDHRITLGAQFVISSELDRRFFELRERSKNGSRLLGTTLREGVTPVYGNFQELSAQAEMQIYAPLTLVPQKVVLPFDPTATKTQRIQFDAKGGDGSFVWHSTQPRYLHINKNGLATTIGRDGGAGKRRGDIYEGGATIAPHASVRVALTRNSKVVRQAEVYFLPPVKLEIVKYNFETALNDRVLLHVAMYAHANETLVPYTQCENLVLDLEFSQQIFRIEVDPKAVEMAPGACQVVPLVGAAVGLTHLRVSYEYQGKVLQDEVTLSVFEALAVLRPLENEVVLPIGATHNVIYLNGPQRIFTLETELTTTMEYNKKIAYVSKLKVESISKPIHALTVLCRNVGETELKFIVYNALLAKNFQPHPAMVTTKVHCVKPRFLNLYATEELRSSCPLEMKNSLLHLKERDNRFEIEIEVQDIKNRRLMNISSLLIDWAFAAGEERFQGDVVVHRRHCVIDEVEGVEIPHKDYLSTTITEVANNMRIKGVVTNYDQNILRQNNIRAEEPHFGILNPKSNVLQTPLIENEIRFMAVNSTFFPSPHLTIFMARNHRERIPIAQGSGHYDYQLSDEGTVRIEFDSKERELLVTPLRVGHARIEVMDRCLMTDPAFLSVSVVAIRAIHAEAPDRVERSKSIEAVVRLYDTNDELLPIDPFNLQIYDLAENIFNPEILSLKISENQMNLNLGEIRYTIIGNTLGETKIVFKAGYDEMQAISEPLNIQVFPPLRLYPRNSTLVVGTSVQINHQGGPQPDVNIVYQVHDKKVISMESAIVTAYKLGATKITGKCIMRNPGNGKELVISEDSVEVHVVPLAQIQIKTPLVRIRSGAVMPAAVWGVPDLSPLVLGTLENMHVTWSTNQPDVVDIYNLFADAGIEYGNTDLISVRIKALNPGKARVKATVQLPSGQRLTTSVEVVIFKILELEQPKHITMDWILVAPRSTMQLKANLDNVVFKPDNESHGIFKVTPDGLLNTRDTLGRGLVIAKTFEQTLPIGIEVKNVQYILATLEAPTIKMKHTQEKIPRGMNFVLKVSLHDNLGNEFSHNIEDINDIKYELSQKDIVDVQIGNNMTIGINLPRVTRNMIAISLKDTTGVKHAEDYIKLSVSESKHIYPTKTIFSVGDVICFDSPLALTSLWASSDDHIVSIDKYTGVAKVLGNRLKLGEKIVVTNGDRTSGNFIKYDVEVRDADVIQLLKSYDIFSGIKYRGHFVVRNHLQVDKFANLIAKNVSRCSSALEKMPVKLFRCGLSSKQALGQKLLKHYEVTPIFELETGLYACQIELKSSFNEVISIVKNSDVHFELEAALPNGLTSSMSLKFVPGIRVSQESLYLTDLSDQELTITGLDKILQKVKVTSSDEAFLRVVQDMKMHGNLQYNIKILKDIPMDEQVYIQVKSPETLQDIKVPVQSSSTVLQKCSSRPFNTSTSIIAKVLSNFGLVVAALVILAVTIWVYMSCGTDQPKTQVNTDAFASPLIKQGSTQTHPIRASPPKSPYMPFQTMTYGSPREGSGLGSGTNLSSGTETPIYGSSVLVSPQRRLNRRFL